MREQGIGERVDLRGREGILRHFERSAECPRILDLCSDVGVKRVLDAGGERKLVDRFRSNFRQLGREILGALDAVDLMARGATVIVD